MLTIENFVIILMVVQQEGNAPVDQRAERAMTSWSEKQLWYQNDI